MQHIVVDDTEHGISFAAVYRHCSRWDDSCDSFTNYHYQQWSRINL